ncbi:Toll-like receptor 4 [Mytilus edulis]|uniref:Toll-like receptor 4 n=1 Tax=Mytilus edulis TaxID=6550 RepID=A0A8S3UZY4_MYTED|nr:Toll-like receptor 4 [Mytilus edulis]
MQEIDKECKSYTVLITCLSVAITACGIAIATGLIYRYRWKIRYLYYLSKGKYYSYKPVDYSTQTYKYDAFISFSEIDLRFIKNGCIPQLEIKNNLKLCIHNRDFMPGEEITVNITNAIHNSRKTICVISRAFLDSYYCKFEFNMARMESIYSRGGENILLLVFYEQILPRELPLVMLELVQEQSYIEYPHDDQGNVVFWEKLKEAIA